MAKVIVRGDLDLQKNKILNGGFEVVDTLPTTDYFEGRQVYNSQNKKLYICRNNGTSTATNYKWEIVGSNIKTIAKEGVPTTEDMSANDIAYDEIFIWQDTKNEKSYLYQNVSGAVRKCGNEDEIQAEVTDLQNNRFKVFSKTIDEWSTTEDNEYMCSKNFSDIDANLHTVAGVTILMGNEEQILFTKIDNTGKVITITSNVSMVDVELIVYGWVSIKETE